MADDGIMATNAQIVIKAGVGANATAITVAETDKIVLMVEGFVNAFTQYNWSDAWAALNVDVKSLLSGVVSDLCAIYVINQDFTGYNSIREAESMINVLTNRANQQLGILRDKEVQTFVTGA